MADRGQAERDAPAPAQVTDFAKSTRAGAPWSAGKGNWHGACLLPGRCTEIFL